VYFAEQQGIKTGEKTKYGTEQSHPFASAFFKESNHA
jgi:hypothetical protein